MIKDSPFQRDPLKNSETATFENLALDCDPHDIDWSLLLPAEYRDSSLRQQTAVRTPSMDSAYRSQSDHSLQADGIGYATSDDLGLSLENGSLALASPSLSVPEDVSCMLSQAQATGIQSPHIGMDQAVTHHNLAYGASYSDIFSEQTSPHRVLSRGANGLTTAGNASRQPRGPFTGTLDLFQTDGQQSPISEVGLGHHSYRPMVGAPQHLLSNGINQQYTTDMQMFNNRNNSSASNSSLDQQTSMSSHFSDATQQVPSQLTARSIDDYAHNFSAMQSPLDQHLAQGFGSGSIMVEERPLFATQSPTFGHAANGTLDNVSRVSEVDSEINTTAVAVLGHSDGEENGARGNARTHQLYTVEADEDGLFHCPFAQKESCKHPATKLKCGYDKYLDSHLKPFRCKYNDCNELQFSSTACLLRHEREAHRMHGHDAKLCTYTGCERSQPGNGFPRKYNLYDHMKRVHGHQVVSDQPGSPPSSSPQIGGQSRRGSKPKSTAGREVASGSKADGVKKRSRSSSRTIEQSPLLAKRPRGLAEREKSNLVAEWKRLRGSIAEKMQMLQGPWDLEGAEDLRNESTRLEACTRAICEKG